MKKRFSLFDALGAVVLAATLAVSSGCAKKEVKKVGERKTRVRLGQITQRVLNQRVPVQGTVCPVEFATISAKISGTVEMLKVDEGDRVAAKTELFGIDRQVLKNQVTVCESEIKVKEAVLANAMIALENAKISLHKAKLDYDRSEKLLKSNSTSQAEFEVYETGLRKAETDVRSAEAAIANARAQLEQANSNLTIARKNLADSTICAPFDCVVTERYVEENEYVSSGKNILKLENQNQLEVIAYISSVYYHRVVVGKTKVEFKLDGEKLGEGVVTFRAPSVDDVSRTFKIKMLVPAGVKLVSGTLCDVDLVLESKKAYSLPTDSLLLRANHNYLIYGVDAKGRAKSFEVKRGMVDGAYCEVIGAEKLLNEKIIISGQTFVNNGSLLEIVADK